jgi:hypothetical protein
MERSVRNEEEASRGFSKTRKGSLLHIAQEEFRGLCKLSGEQVPVWIDINDPLPSITTVSLETGKVQHGGSGSNFLYHPRDELNARGALTVRISRTAGSMTRVRK